MCALFGIHDYSDCFTSKQKNIILSVLSQECEVRGTDATGISYVKDNKMQVYKRPCSASLMWYNLPPKITAVMGHTRLTTQGNAAHNYNNHPFFGRTSATAFSLAHNGIIYNDKDLRKTMNLPDTYIDTDSYIAVQLIERENALNFNSLQKVAESLRGSFVLTVLDCKNNLYFVRGDNPICIYHFPEFGFYLYASTEEILKKAIARLGISKLAHERVPVDIGDILRINSRGEVEMAQFECKDFYQRNYNYYHYPMYIYAGNLEFDSEADEKFDSQYLEILKQVAQTYGYTPHDIAELLAEGWSLAEIEQIVYDEDFIYDGDEAEVFCEAGAKR